MKILWEENIEDWGNIEDIGLYANTIPVLYMHHVMNKFDSHITDISNKYLLGISSIGYKETINAFLHNFDNEKEIRECIIKAMKTDDYRWKQNIDLTLIRPFKTKYGFAYLFYNVVIIITKPFISGNEKPKDMDNEEWVDNIINLRPNLSGYSDIVEYADRPVFIIKAFTGGFKQDYHPYKDKGMFNSIHISKKLSEIDISNNTGLKNKLVQYQRSCI